MAQNVKTVNLWANANADIGSISDSTPTLRVWSTVSVASTAQGYALQVDNTGNSPALVVTQNALTAGATIAPLQVVASLASQAFISFQGVFISTASISQVGGGSAFVIPVYHASQNIWGFINVSKGVV